VEAARPLWRIAASKREFADSPIGAYYVDRTWFAFHADAQLTGLVVWGQFTEADTLSLIDVFRGDSNNPGRVGIVDTRDLAMPDLASFHAFTSYVRGRSFDRYIGRVAIVHSTGPVGAMAAGFPKVLPMPFSMEAFTDINAALTWLGRSDAHDLASEMEAIRAKLSSTSILVRNVREYVTLHLRNVTINTAAAALGYSVRNLQRRLGELGTSFRDELNRARVRVAMQQLADGDAPLARIASTIGWRSSQHFANSFRRFTGTTPGAWRARRRA
jgi:AraC-like DNA-binding protein